MTRLYSPFNDRDERPAEPLREEFRQVLTNGSSLCRDAFIVPGQK